MTRKKKTGEILIKVKKDFTHAAAGKLSDELRSALNKSVAARLVLSDITSVDLSSIQLLVSAADSFKKGEVPLIIELNCSDDVKTLMRNCGFGDLPESKPAAKY